MLVFCVRWFLNSTLALVCLVPSISRAELCNDLLSLGSNEETFLSRNDKALVQNISDQKYIAYANAAEETIQSVKRYLPNMESPENLKVLITGSYLGHPAAYFNNYSIIRVEMTPPPGSVFARNNHVYRPAGTSAYIAHEYGHALFSENMKRKSTVWADGQEAVESLSGRQLSNQISYWVNLQTQFDRQSIELVHDINEPAAKANSLSVEDEAEVLNTMLGHHMDRMDLYDFADLIKMSLPYQELFSDFVSVIDTGHPIDIANVLGLLEGSSVSYGRAMLFRIGSRCTDDNDTHNALNPLREYLWENYFNTFSYHERETAGEILEQVFNVLAQDLVERSNGTITQNFTMAELNQHLIERFKKDPKMENFRIRNDENLKRNLDNTNDWIIIRDEDDNIIWEKKPGVNMPIPDGIFDL